MIRLVFSDVDGTLLQNNEQGEYTISACTAEKIRQATASGIHFALATGRPVDFIPNLYGEQFRFDTVAYSGASVWACGKRIYQSSFSVEEALAIQNAIKAKGVELLCITDRNEYCFANRITEFIDEFENQVKFRDHRKIFEEDLSAFSESYPQQDFVSLVVLCNNDEELIRASEKAAALGYDPVKVRNNGYSMMKPGINKAEGIRRVAQLYNVSLEEIAVLGDSMNDMEMFQLVQESYAMEKSAPAILKCGKHKVRDVAEALQQIMENNHAGSGFSKL